MHQFTSLILCARLESFWECCLHSQTPSNTALLVRQKLQTALIVAQTKNTTELHSIRPAQYFQEPSYGHRSTEMLHLSQRIRHHKCKKPALPRYRSRFAMARMRYMLLLVPQILGTEKTLEAPQPLRSRMHLLRRNLSDDQKTARSRVEAAPLLWRLQQNI